MNTLANMLHNDEDVDKNPQKAFQLYNRAIESRDAHAMYNLASMLEDGGEGVDKDIQRPLQLYQPGC